MIMKRASWSLAAFLVCAHATAGAGLTGRALSIVETAAAPGLSIQQADVTLDENAMPRLVLRVRNDGAVPVVGFRARVYRVTPKGRALGFQSFGYEGVAPGQERTLVRQLDPGTLLADEKLIIGLSSVRSATDVWTADHLTDTALGQARGGLRDVVSGSTKPEAPDQNQCGQGFCAEERSQCITAVCGRMCVLEFNCNLQECSSVCKCKENCGRE